MKHNKIVAILYFFSAIAFYITSALTFTSDGSTGMGVMWLCIGSTFLALGVVYFNLNKSNGNQNDKDDKSD